MTETEWLEGQGKLTVLIDCQRLQMARIAEYATQKFGDEYLRRVEDLVEVDEAGKPRRVEPFDPGAEGPPEELCRFAAGFYLARRYLAQGHPPAEARRQAMGRLRTLSRTWQGTEYDRVAGLKQCRRGVRKGLAEPT